jgi:c-di-GMP-related signal transduction protein
MALDTITPGDPRLGLVDAVDLVKVDVLASGDREAIDLIRSLSAAGIDVVAEKVEEPAAFDRVIGAGAALVQGFFFTRPRVVRSQRPLGLSSVRPGLLMLGSRAVHRWVRLLILSSLVRDQHPGLMTLASVRGRYCEALEQRHGTGRGLEAFAAGMFSVLGAEAVLPEETLAQLPVHAEVRAALRGEPNHFRTLLDIQIAAERADWPRLVRLGAELGVSNSALAAAHVDALTWAKQLSGLTDGHRVGAHFL